MNGKCLLGNSCDGLNKPREEGFDCPIKKHFDRVFPVPDMCVQCLFWRPVQLKEKIKEAK